MAAQSILASSAGVSLLSLTVSLVNYLTLAIMASLFGAGLEVDAYFAASTIPQLLLAVLSSSIINAFLPFFISKKRDGNHVAWPLANKAIRLLFFSLLSLAIISYLFSFPFIKLINPGFSLDTARLTASLFGVFFFAAPFSGTSILLTALHFSFHRFIFPTLAQLINSGLTIAFLLAFHNSLGIKSLVWGTFVGSVCQFLLLLKFPLAKGKDVLKSQASWKEISVFWRLLFPLLLASLFYRANPLVERYLASKLGEGNIAYLGYATRIITALTILLSQGISTVLFPRMAEAAAASDLKKLAKTFSSTIQNLFFLVIPTGVFLFCQSQPIVSLLFERGNFSSSATKAISLALLAYGGYFILGVLALPIVNIFYSLQETRLVAGIGIFGFGIYVALAIFLSRYFGFVGIALASSFQYLFAFSLFILSLKRRFGFLPGREMGKILLESLLASLAAIISVKLIDFIFFKQPGSLLLLLSSHLLIFGLIYLAILKIIKSEALAIFSFSKIFSQKPSPRF